MHSRSLHSDDRPIEQRLTSDRAQLTLKCPSTTLRRDGADYQYFRTVYESFAELVPLLGKLGLSKEAETVAALVDLCAVHVPTLIQVRLGFASEISRFCSKAAETARKQDRRAPTERLLRELLQPLIQKLADILERGKANMHRCALTALAVTAGAADVKGIVDHYGGPYSNEEISASLFERRRLELPWTENLAKRADPKCPCCRVLLIEPQGAKDDDASVRRVRRVRLTREMIDAAPRGCACRIALFRARRAAPRGDD